MATIKFKTNINCEACISKVTPVLNDNDEIKSWEVDTSTPQKILTIESDEFHEEELQHALKKVGYQAERLA